MQSIGVETPQHVELSYNPASIGDRLLAFLLDSFVIVGYYLFLQLMIGALHSYDGFPFSVSKNNIWLMVFFYAIVPFLYHLILELIWNGKSFGKWIMNLQVVRVDGTSPTFGAYLIRWLFRLLEITLTIGLIAFLTVLINGKGQRLGDIAAKTTVVKLRSKVKLSDTIYADINSDYIPKYASVIELADVDISTVKEVLASKKKYEYATWFVMVQRTANIIQMRLNIKKVENNADDFLAQIISDYNHLHRS